MNSPTSLVANTAEEKHTPTPWQFSVEDLSIESGTVDSYRIDTAWDHGQLNGPAPVVTLGYSVNSEGKSVVSLMIRPEDAAFIVLACNSFDALTEANKKLREALADLVACIQETRGLPAHNALERARAALKGAA